MRHDTEFIWTEKCNRTFKHLKELLTEHPILWYPGPSHGYILFMDASGIGWAGVLTQEFKDEKGKKKNHPICYVNSQFKGTSKTGLPSPKKLLLFTWQSENSVST